MKIEYCFANPIFRLWFLVTFGEEVTKIQNPKSLFNICLHIARQVGQDGKKTIVTKIPKTYRRKYGMNETFVFVNNMVEKNP